MVCRLLLDLSGNTTPRTFCFLQPRDHRVRYEHGLENDPDSFIVEIPVPLVTNVPASVPRALPPEFITNLIYNANSPTSAFEIL